MQFSKVHCLFEQSGTFKKAFEKLGYKALDYDINKTENVDVQTDLFKQIFITDTEMTKTIFNDIAKDDLVFAFFPCTYFSDQSQLLSRGDSFGQKNWDIEQKLKYSMDKMEERAKFYMYLCKLCLVAIKKGFKLIIENPNGKENFLKQYFPIKPAVIILNRQKMGDFYKKPTQFFFVNCEPEFKLWSECTIKINKKIRIEDNKGFARSIISQDFAETFIKTFIID